MKPQLKKARNLVSFSKKFVGKEGFILKDIINYLKLLEVTRD